MYLIDTHALLWFASDDPRLPSSIRELMETDEQFYVSVGSFWEMAIKNSIGKLTLPKNISGIMDDCTGIGFVPLQINGQHLERLTTLPKIHGDPFDRLLICQAQEENLTIITCDENILKYDVKTIWK